MDDRNLLPANTLPAHHAPRLDYQAIPTTPTLALPPPSATVVLTEEIRDDRNPPRRFLMRTALLLTVLTLSLIVPARGATYVVNPEGTGDYPTIADAVAVCVSNDTIELTDGLFEGDGNRNVFINGKDITIRSQSGSNIACRINCEGPGMGTYRAFLIENSSTFTTVMDIGIENGEAPQDYGGAIAVTTQGTLVLSNVAFRNNYASWGGAVAAHAGGLYITTYDCRFIENHCDAGGGAIYIASGESAWQDCLFLRNEAGIGGGACYCDANGEMDFARCTFSRNLAGHGGGAIYYNGQSDLDMSSCTFSGNSCSGGSAFYIGSDVSADLYHTLIAYTTEGMAIDCNTVNILMENCNLFGNAGGDWLTPINVFLGSDCNIQEDPQFCSEIPDEHEHWVLQEDSPCTALNSQCGIQVGAFGAGCGTTETGRLSWGSIKHEFGR